MRDGPMRGQRHRVPAVACPPGALEHFSGALTAHLGASRSRRSGAEIMSTRRSRGVASQRRAHSPCVPARERLGRAADQLLDDGCGGKEVLDDARALARVERKRLHIAGRAADRGGGAVAVQAAAVGCARDDVPLALPPRNSPRFLPPPAEPADLAPLCDSLTRKRKRMTLSRGACSSRAAASPRPRGTLPCGLNAELVPVGSRHS